MGSAAICHKEKHKIYNCPTTEAYENIEKNIDEYLKIERQNSKNNNNYIQKNEYSHEDKKNQEEKDEKENLDYLVHQSRKTQIFFNEEIDFIYQKSNEKDFKFYLKTNKLKQSNLSKNLNSNNLVNIVLELLCSNQQNNVKSVNHINLFNSLTFPKILNDSRNRDSMAMFETTEYSEKTNFRIVYNKHMQDIMNNIYFPNEFKHLQRNTINFSLNSISVKDLPGPLTQLNITASNINGGPQIMDISNSNNLIFNTQPNEDFILRRNPSNFTNFNAKIKNCYTDTEKNSNNNDSSSFNGILDGKKESIASKTIKKLYDSIFKRNSIQSNGIFNNSNNPNNQIINNINNINSSNQQISNYVINNSFRYSVAPQFNSLKRQSLSSKNKSDFLNNLPKTNLDTIEDIYYDDISNYKIDKIMRIKAMKKKKLENTKKIQDREKLARKIFYSLDVRSKLLERKQKIKELMKRSLSDLEEEYNILKEEINPIFEIKNAIEEKNTSKTKKNYLNTYEKKETARNKKQPIVEIDMKQLIKETITEKIFNTENNISNHDRENTIKFKNFNINNININIQNHTEGDQSISPLRNKKYNTNINASSEFINYIETFTNINNTQNKIYDKNKRIYIEASGKKNNYKKLKNLNDVNIPKNNYSSKIILKKNYGYSKKEKIIKNNKIFDFKLSDSKNKQSLEQTETLITQRDFNLRRQSTNDLNNNFIDENDSKISSNFNNIPDLIFNNIILESPLQKKSLFKLNGEIFNNGEYFEKTKKVENINNFDVIRIQTNDNDKSNSNNEKSIFSTQQNEKEGNNYFDQKTNFIDTSKVDMPLNSKNQNQLQRKSYISGSKSFTESELVSSFDSRDIESVDEYSKRMQQCQKNIKQNNKEELYEDKISDINNSEDFKTSDKNQFGIDPNFCQLINIKFHTNDKESIVETRNNKGFMIPKYNTRKTQIFTNPSLESGLKSIKNFDNESNIYNMKNLKTLLRRNTSTSNKKDN